jgi:HSP20 family molecular chaperone IbpA
LDRDFKNKIENKDGSVDQISKVETITKKVIVDEILDPKTIKKQYKDGKLTINIARA